MKCPCEECICLAICVNKIERYASMWMLSSLSKNCEILNNYLFGDTTSEKIANSRTFYNSIKGKP